MKHFLFLGLVVGAGVGLWRLWIAFTDQRPQFVSDRWRSDRERLDLIAGNQWDGIVKWPWDGDDAA